VHMKRSISNPLIVFNQRKEKDIYSWRLDIHDKMPPGKKSQYHCEK